MVVAATATTLLACVPANDSYPTLSNQGILSLSTVNPYLGTNLFLSREMESSRYLHNFIRGNGAPVAIEIMDPPMSATRMLMFYPSQKSVYAADLVVQSESRQWVVQGPFPIARRDYRNLLQMELSMHGEPVFLIDGNQVRYPGQRPKPPVQRVVLPAVPTPRPTPRPVIRRPAAAQPAQQAKPQPTATPLASPTATLPFGVPGIGKDFKPLNTDQQAYLISQGYAERADNGDIIHTVSGDKENLKAIAKWYTESESTVDAIVSANGVKEDTPLVTGTKLRIPMEHIKNLKAMPAPGQ